MALSFSSQIMLCLASVALLSPHHAACVASAAAPAGCAAEGVVLEDEVALLHGADMSTVRKRGGPSRAESDVVLVQTEATVNSSGSSSGSADFISTFEVTSTGELAPAANTAVNDAMAEEIEKGAEADEEVFESWLPAEKSAEFVEADEVTVAEVATSEVTAEKLSGAKMAAEEVAAAEVVEEDVEDAAAQVAVAAAQKELDRVPVAFASFGRRTASALDSASDELGLHVPVILALLVLVAAIFMVILTTLKNWAGMLFDAPAEVPAPAEKPNPLQALRVLQLNLDNAGHGKAMASLNAKPNFHIAAEKTMVN